jgi:hypothetical protein
MDSRLPQHSTRTAQNFIPAIHSFKSVIDEEKMKLSAE